MEQKPAEAQVQAILAFAGRYRVADEAGLSVSRLLLHLPHHRSCLGQRLAAHPPYVFVDARDEIEVHLLCAALSEVRALIAADGNHSTGCEQLNLVTRVEVPTDCIDSG
jgi:hypothetical protein